MIDEKRMENIRTYVVHHNTGAQRARILFEDLGLAKDRKAEYVILSGCHPPETLPRTTREAFAYAHRIFSQLPCWMGD